MDIEKLAEKIRDVVLGELKDEFKEFRASVTGELSGFRLAMESINARQSSIETRLMSVEQELRDIRRAIDGTNKKIDEVRDHLLVRADETNKRMDSLFMEVSKIRGDLNKALSDKEIIHDIIFRLERVETKVAA